MKQKLEAVRDLQCKIRDARENGNVELDETQKLVSDIIIIEVEFEGEIEIDLNRDV